MSAAEARTLVLDVDAASIRTGDFDGAVAFHDDTLVLRRLAWLQIAMRPAHRRPEAVAEHEMTAGPSGLPGTTPLAMAAAEESALPAPAAEDAPWATTFGAINVADHPTAIAVRAEEVYVGGDFFTQMAGLPEYTYIRVAHWDGSAGCA